MNYFLDSLMRKLISNSNERILLPFYHKISDKKNTFTKHLYTPRKIIDFKEDLAVFKKYYKPISMQEFIEISESKVSVNKNYFHVTFMLRDVDGHNTLLFYQLFLRKDQNHQ